MNLSNQKSNLRKKYLQKLEDCLENNKKIPHAIRDDAKTMVDDIIYNREEETLYKMTKVCVTTSHSPTTKLREFSKHLSLILNGKFLQRSGYGLNELKKELEQQDYTHVIILNESKGNPSNLILCSLVFHKTYFFTISNLVFNRRKETFSESVHLILDNVEDEFKKTLQMMLPKKKIKTSKNRVLGLIGRNGSLLFRHFLVQNRKLVKDCSCNLLLYKITNSTFDDKNDKNVIYNLGVFKNSPGKKMLH